MLTLSLTVSIMLVNVYKVNPNIGENARKKTGFLRP